MPQKKDGNSRTTLESTIRGCSVKVAQRALTSPRAGFDSLHSHDTLPGSFNGRTPRSERGYGGSNPPPGSKVLPTSRYRPRSLTISVSFVTPRRLGVWVVTENWPEAEWSSTELLARRQKVRFLPGQLFCRRSSKVEQRFRKAKGWGPIPLDGSTPRSSSGQDAGPSTQMEEFNSPTGCQGVCERSVS